MKRQPAARWPAARLLATALALGALWAVPAAAADLAVDAGDFPLIRVYLGSDPPSAGQPAAAVTEDGRLAFDPIPLDAGSTVPLRVALVVDTSGSMEPAMEAVRQAAAEAVQRLEPSDALALIAFADTVQVLAEPTRDRGRLGAAIAGLKAGGSTALYDAVNAGVQQVREAGGNRRAVVVLTDGKDESVAGAPGSALRLQPLKQALAEAGVPVYALALGADADLGALEEIAAASGGRVYSAARPDALADLYADVFASLRARSGWRYVSPALAPDGTRRTVEVALPDGRHWSGSYPAPREPGVAWRYTRSAEPGSLCGAAGLSPQGTLALIPRPATLVREDGRLVAALAQADAGPFERMAVLEDGTGFGFTGSGGTAFAPPDAAIGAAPAALSPRQAGAAGTPGAPIAVSPSGARLLWMALPPGATRPTFTARAVDGAALWERALCPYASCDRVAGADIADDGAALLNLTGVLQRIGADGKPGATRRETIFPQLSLSADGRLAAAVVWRPAPKRALLLDDALRTVGELPIRSYLDAVPAVAAVSPDGRWFAARDDFRVQLLDRAGGRSSTHSLPRLRPGPTCALTLAVDNRGRVLTGDGASVFLLDALAGNPR